MDVYLINYQYCLIVYYFLKCYQHPNYFYNCCPMHRMHHIYAWARYDKLNSCINGSIFFQGKCAHLHKHLNVVSLNIADMCISSIYPTRYIELMHILRVDGLEWRPKSYGLVRKYHETCFCDWWILKFSIILLWNVSQNIACCLHD